MGWVSIRVADELWILVNTVKYLPFGLAHFRSDVVQSPERIREADILFVTIHGLSAAPSRHAAALSAFYFSISLGQKRSASTAFLSASMTVFPEPESKPDFSFITMSI